MSSVVEATIKVADEVFLAAALLHRENPDREDFTIREIVDRVRQENIAGNLRPGVAVHVSLQCVANRAPNPGKYAVLYATSARRRRLLRQSDDIHPLRTGKTFPDPEDVPAKYRELIEWARKRYGEGGAKPAEWLEGIVRMFGSGKHLWKGVDPDEYVRKLREG